MRTPFPKPATNPPSALTTCCRALRDGLTAEDREARLRALQTAFDRPEKSIHLLRVLLDAEYDPRTRQRAASALGQIGDAQSVPALLGILDDQNPNVRRVAIWALGQIGGEEAHSSLIDLLETETDKGTQHLLVEALGGCTDVQLVPLLLDLRVAYQKGHKTHRRSSDHIAHIAEHGIQDQLITLLDHDDREVQRWAARVVSERCPPTVENIPLLLKCAELGAELSAFEVIAQIDDESIWDIFNQYLHDDRRAMCRAVLRALARIGTNRSVGMIIDFLRTNKREELALDALSILSGNDGLNQCPFSSELVPVLINLVKTATERYQLRFIHYLAEIDDERVLAKLWAICQKSDNLAIRHIALAHLYSSIQPSMLLELLDDEEPEMRQHAARCVHWLNEQQVFSESDYDALIEGVRSRLAHENDVETRLTYTLILLDEDRTDQLLEMAYQGLYKVSYDFCDEYPEIIRSLFEHLMSDDSVLQTKVLDLARSHPDSETRYEFIRALNHLGDERVISLILERLRSDSDVAIRRLCAYVMGNYPPSPTIIEALTEALKDDVGRYPVCREAASSLHDIGTPEALAAVETWERNRPQQ